MESSGSAKERTFGLQQKMVVVQCNKVDQSSQWRLKEVHEERLPEREMASHKMKVGNW